MTKEHISEVCKIGQGASCCKYLAAGSGGMQCLKLTSLKSTIDSRTNMTAKSDNCEGIKT